MANDNDDYLRTAPVDQWPSIIEQFFCPRPARGYNCQYKPLSSNLLQDVSAFFANFAEGADVGYTSFCMFHHVLKGKMDIKFAKAMRLYSDSCCQYGLTRERMGYYYHCKAVRDGFDLAYRLLKDHHYAAAGERRRGGGASVVDDGYLRELEFKYASVKDRRSSSAKSSVSVKSGGGGGGGGRVSATTPPTPAPSFTRFVVGLDCLSASSSSSSSSSCSSGSEESFSFVSDDDQVY